MHTHTHASTHVMVNVLQSFLVICDWIYGNRSKSHIGGYKSGEAKNLNTLQPAEDGEHTTEAYPDGRTFHGV